MTKNTGKRAALKAETMVERFLRLSPTGEPDACWEWPRTTTAGGYGKFGHNYADHYAHRAAYQAHFGEIPPGMEVCHRCDNPPCVNPEHLFLGTHQDNMVDRVQKGRHPHKQTVAGSAHPLAKLNEEKVRYIRSSPKTGVELAAELGVATTLISRVRSRQCWPNVA